MNWSTIPKNNCWWCWRDQFSMCASNTLANNKIEMYLHRVLLAAAILWYLIRLFLWAPSTWLRSCLEFHLLFFRRKKLRWETPSRSVLSSPLCKCNTWDMNREHRVRLARTYSHSSPTVSIHSNLYTSICHALFKCVIPAHIKLRRPPHA